MNRRIGAAWRHNAVAKISNTNSLLDLDTMPYNFQPLDDKSHTPESE